MEGRPHVCAKCDWRATGEVWLYFVYDRGKQNRQVIWMKCRQCRAPGFRHLGSEVVYTWSTDDLPIGLEKG